MNYKNSIKFFIVTTISIFLVSCGTTQTAAEKAEKKQLIDKQIERLNFKFVANHVYPMGFSSHPLSPYYDVTVSPDTVKAHLPYFGRAYKAPMGERESGTQFESTDFEYEIEKGKKEGLWHVTIRPQDTSGTYTLFFHIWNNGNARLNINDQDRQPISFDGEIKENNKEDNSSD